jgi:broad specificity phosphatase PhoE
MKNQLPTDKDAMNQTVIHLVRHGHVHNPNKVLYGRLPRFRLSEKGRQQARAAGEHLAQHPLAAVFSSPLLRARQTAGEILTFFPDLKLRTSILLNEVCTAYEGLPASQVDRRNGDIYTGVAACFEQPSDVYARVAGLYRRIRTRYAGRHVAAVSHGDVITFTVLWALGREMTPENKLRLLHAGYAASYPAHASVTSLTFASDSPEERPALTYTLPWQ